MCPAQPYLVLAQTDSLLSLPMKHKLRLGFLLVMVSILINIPVMILQGNPLQS
jgi:hypothetical protein